MKITRYNIPFIALITLFFLLSCEKDEELELSNEDIVSEESYYLYTPMGSSDVYLIDAEGNEMHTWETDYTAGLSVYLLDDGTILCAESERSQYFNAGGSGGRVAMYDASSNKIWSFQYADDTKLLHHDIEMLPNGNVLMIAWRKYTRDEAIEQGINTSLFDEEEIWADHIIEVNPETNQIVWEWNVWDHLIQDFDSSKENYGSVEDNPGKINLNYFGSNDLKDWNHINSVDYNETLDQILLSVHSFSEIWIIDHNTTTAEAATEIGDLIYRYGNPEACNQSGDRKLYFQHDAKWLENDRILIFNNGDRQLRPYSSIDEIQYSDANILGATTTLWTYYSGTDFYATNISGSQRLDNGNTLICDGPHGYFFEVTPEGEKVWEYTNPYTSTTPNGEMNSVFRVTSYDADYSGVVNVIK